MNLTAIILAGGQSLRMGTDKALMPYHGKPLILYSIDLALRLTKRIIIASNQEELLNLGLPIVKDIIPFMAPLAGIHAGLLFSKTDWNLILTCDMPNVSSNLINYLLSNTDEKTELILPAHDGYIEPLCGFYHRNLIPLIETNIGKNLLSPLDLLKVVPHRIVQVKDVIDEKMSIIFKNVNSRNDL